MDDPRQLLIAAAAARGESLAALSAVLGRNAAYLQQYVQRGSPRVLAEADRRRLAAFLGIPDADLGGPPADERFVVSRLDLAASAGPGALVDAEVALGAETIDSGLARRLGLARDQAAIIRVRGDSMAPGLLDGDLILVDRARRIPDARGGVFVIRIDGTLMVKRVRTDAAAGLHAASDNPAAPALPAGAIEVIGLVVWLMRQPR